MVQLRAVAAGENTGGRAFQFPDSAFVTDTAAVISDLAVVAPSRPSCIAKNLITDFPYYGRVTKTGT